jgi:hypothetical protein
MGQQNTFAGDDSASTSGVTVAVEHPNLGFVKLVISYGEYSFVSTITATSPPVDRRSMSICSPDTVDSLFPRQVRGLCPRGVAVNESRAIVMERESEVPRIPVAKAGCFTFVLDASASRRAF